MLESSLVQLEELVKVLLQQNQTLLSSNAKLQELLLQSKAENEDLQLNALEQEEQHAATVARIQALVDLAATGNSSSSIGGT